MKKSEYLEQRRAHWRSAATLPMEANWIPGWIENHIANDAAAAEAAGVVWDPEEEPLPKKLEVAIGGGGCSFIAPRGGLWAGEAARRRAFDEAVRRYNAWPELEKLAEEPTGGALIPGTPTGRWFTVGEPTWRERLRAILRGS